MKVLYGLVTTACVKSNQQIDGFYIVFLKDADAVAEFSQDPGPAKGRHPIAVSGSRGGRSNDSDSH